MDWVILSFPWKEVCVCNYVILSVCFLPIVLWDSHSLLSLSLSFGPDWQDFYWYKILKNFVDLPCMSQGFIILDKRLRSFLDNPSLFLILLDGWGKKFLSFLETLWFEQIYESHLNIFKKPFVNFCYFWGFSKSLSIHTICFFPLQYICLTVTLVILVSFLIWMGWDFPKSSNLGLYLLNSSFLNLFLASHILL